MSEIKIDYEMLTTSVNRFNGSLTRLEQNLAMAVTTIAELARKTGYEDGKADALAALNENNEDLILREELAAAKAREKNLELAIKEARGALSETIDDIKNVLGAV